MKLIEAIIPPSKLETIQEALSKIGVVRLVASDVEGLSDEKDKEEIFKEKHILAGTQRKVKIEIAVNEAFLKPAIDCILKAGGHSGEHEGIGKIFVIPLEDVIRIRNGERGPDAI